MANAYTLVGGSSAGDIYTGDNPITPTTTAITIPTDTMFEADLKVKGDSNLVSSNIMQGNTIFGVVGSVESVEYSGNIGVAYVRNIFDEITRWNITSITNI
jgi:hypothetical protein